MLAATRELKNEHKAVELMLNILTSICERLEKEERIDPTHLNRIVEFLKVFVDKCHHGKEEELLFPELEKLGVENTGGPVGVMLYEHQIGREYIKGLSDSIEKYTSGNPAFGKEIVEFARNYSNLLFDHIEKENNVLFPLADKLISDEGQELLAKGFKEIEEERIGAGKHEEFHELLKELKAEYL